MRKLKLIALAGVVVSSLLIEHANAAAGADITTLHMAVRGTDNGVYFASSTNSGKTWTAHDKRTGIGHWLTSDSPQILAVDDTMHIVVRGMDGRIYRASSSDSGATWTGADKATGITHYSIYSDPSLTTPLCSRKAFVELRDQVSRISDRVSSLDIGKIERDFKTALDLKLSTSVFKTFVEFEHALATERYFVAWSMGGESEEVRLRKEIAAAGAKKKVDELAVRSVLARAHSEGESRRFGERASAIITSFPETNPLRAELRRIFEESVRLATPPAVPVAAALEAHRSVVARLLEE